MSEEFHFFWSGPFSQWAPSRFTIDGIVYETTEQWMMAEKARLFNDDETLKKILKTKKPKEQKALGRQVKNFNPGKWNSKAKDIVYIGNKAKFKQDKRLLQILFDTYPKTLVEASPFDKIWGIGLAEDDKLAQNRNTWQGTNWLGEVLTQLRNDLMKEKGLIT